MSKKEITISNIKLDKLVLGGQCIAHTDEGKRVFVWGGLPGELVDIRITKKKSSYLEGVVCEIHEKSNDRIEPREPLSYLSTSPWQIVSFPAENKAKQQILTETFTREGIEGITWSDFYNGSAEYGYRNKQEYGFWGDDDGLHLAHFVRGTHGKQKVQGSALAMECINEAARTISDELNRLGVWGGDLKTVMLRANQKKQVVGALFIKKELDMGNLQLLKGLKGLDIYYSEPKSPASVPTKKLYSFGDIKLLDDISGKNIMYDVMSFFQVNLPVFETALESIKKHINSKEQVIDMYSGVGTIGIAVSAEELIESDSANIAMAKANAKGLNMKVTHASSENALDSVKKGVTVLVDPPRAGLHKDVIDRIKEVKPRKVIYLSCNPSTQARDVKLLEESYKITFAQGYNFFPRTPHIESLLVLELR